MHSRPVTETFGEIRKILRTILAVGPMFTVTVLQYQIVIGSTNPTVIMTALRTCRKCQSIGKTGLVVALLTFDMVAT